MSNMGFVQSRPSDSIEGNFTGEAGEKGAGDPLAFLSAYKGLIPAISPDMLKYLLIAAAVFLAYKLLRK